MTKHNIRNTSAQLPSKKAFISVNEGITLGGERNRGAIRSNAEFSLLMLAKNKLFFGIVKLCFVETKIFELDDTRS